MPTKIANIKESSAKKAKARSRAGRSNRFFALPFVKFMLYEAKRLRAARGWWDEAVCLSKPWIA